MAVAPTVLVKYRYSAGKVQGRLLDLAYIEGQPVAVLSWVRMNGSPRRPDQYAALDPQFLRSSPNGAVLWYDGIIGSDDVH
jgi:hypothetical protein